MTTTSPFTVAEYLDVEERAAELGYNVPTGFAILPRNFATAESKEKLLHEDTAPTVRLLLREKGLEETPLEKEGDKISYIEENGFEWVGPTIFIGATIFSQNPNVLGVALGGIANYLTDYFKGRFGKRSVKMSIVVPQPRSKKNVRIAYDGDVEGLKELPKIIREVRNGRKTP